jgi:hypothetical protein
MRRLGRGALRFDGLGGPRAVTFFIGKRFVHPTRY